MRGLRIFDEKLISGLFIIACSTACFILMISVFYTGSGDEQIVLDQMYQEIVQEKKLTSGKHIPDVRKWDFTISLPVEGASGIYHWTVSGAYSTTHRENEQLIYNFVGEVMDKENPVRLISPRMIFDDAREELRTNEPIFADLGWCSISGRGLRLKWKKDDIDVRDDVEVALERAELPEELGIADTVEAEDNGDHRNPDVESDKKEDEDKIVITSDKLRILGVENKLIFTGNVLMRDKKGTIDAEKVEVLNYSKEETKADPIKKGIKFAICTDHVKIDLEDQAAKCHKAEFNAETNIITLFGTKVDGEYVQVEYWQKDEIEKDKGIQILCDKMTIDRVTKEVVYEGNTRSTDFNPSKSSFLDFGLDEEDEQKDDSKDK